MVDFLLLDFDGNVYSFGNANDNDGCYRGYSIDVQGYYGKLGLGDSKDRKHPVKVPISDITSISNGDYRVMMLKNNGDVYICGCMLDMRYLGLGLEEKANPVTTPTKVESLCDISIIALGSPSILYLITTFGKNKLSTCD